MTKETARALLELADKNVRLGMGSQISWAKHWRDGAKDNFRGCDWEGAASCALKSLHYTVGPFHADYLQAQALLAAAAVEVKRGET